MSTLLYLIHGPGTSSCSWYCDSSEIRGKNVIHLTKFLVDLQFATWKEIRLRSKLTGICVPAPITRENKYLGTLFFLRSTTDTGCCNIVHFDPLSRYCTCQTFPPWANKPWILKLSKNALRKLWSVFDNLLKSCEPSFPS